MENKYWIGKSSITGNVVLFAGDDCGFYIHVEDGYQVCAGDFQKSIKQQNFKDITADYLRNTYGEVESKEYADFITWLAGNAGINVRRNCEYDESLSFFCIHNGELIFLANKEVACDSGEREIKLPMPPKESKLNLNPNCVLNPIHDGLNNCKESEWPKVGSIVTWGFKSYKGEVKAIDGDAAFIKVTNGDYEIKSISKLEMLTLDDELKFELQDLLMSSCDVIGAVNLLMSKYNIKKKSN